MATYDEMTNAFELVIAAIKIMPPEMAKTSIAEALADADKMLAEFKELEVKTLAEIGHISELSIDDIKIVQEFKQEMADMYSYLENHYKRQLNKIKVEIENV